MPRWKILAVVIAGLALAALSGAGPARADVVAPTVGPAASAAASPDDTASARPAEASAAAASPGAGQPAAEVCTPKPPKKPNWGEQIPPILVLLLVIGVVIARLPRQDLGHSMAFRRRRVLNWLPLGLTYSFLYMARYNLNAAKLALECTVTVDDFSAIFAAGTVTYGISFLINGPLTDRIGGKLAILIGAIGAAIMNIAMGLAIDLDLGTGIVPLYMVLYSANMYFQSFGAVAIVKVNAPWFHVRERGTFGAIFGILISLGLYFAYDWGGVITSVLPTQWVFYIPAAILLVFAALDAAFVRDSPGQAGHADFDTADASSGDDGPRLPVVKVFKMLLGNPVILTIAFIEFCSGFLRQAIMQYYKIYAKAIGQASGWIYDNWGLILCIAGVLGGTVAGLISDRVFGSRRGPVAALLYAVMLVGSLIALMLLGNPLIGVLMSVMSMAIIGVHGMLSGTASMDFGGRRNAGVAVGIIDGFVYLGTGFMSALYFAVLPGKDAEGDPAAWIAWPLAMVPMALLGLVLARRIWHAMPKGKGPAAPQPGKAG
ncbi:MAG: hypothetical protein AMXMBFR64_31660 [Myxococcales bacterium]